VNHFPQHSSPSATFVWLVQQSKVDENNRKMIHYTFSLARGHALVITPPVRLTKNSIMKNPVGKIE
jgi:hypothetical protein